MTYPHTQSYFVSYLVLAMLLLIAPACTGRSSDQPKADLTGEYRIVGGERNGVPIDQNELDAAAERMRQRGGGLNPPGQPPSEVEDQPATQPTTQPSPEAATQPSTPPTEPAGTQPQGGPAAEAGAGVASATAPADPITCGS